MISDKCKEMFTKLLILSIVLSSSMGIGVIRIKTDYKKVKAENKKIEALKAYKNELLKTKSKIGHGKATSFFIKDVDGDKVPELIMYFSSSSQVYLCTYKNNHVQCLVEAKYGLNIYNKNHIVMWSYETGDNPCDYWYKISKGKAKLVAYKSQNIYWNSGVRYTNQYFEVNGKKVKKKEYDKYVKKIKGKKLKYSMIKNTKENLNKYLNG